MTDILHIIFVDFFVNEDYHILIQIALKFVLKDPIGGIFE